MLSYVTASIPSVQNLFLHNITKMDDSDSDFADVVEPIGEERSVNDNEKGTKVRGESIAWIELHRFETAKDFKSSDIAKKIEEEFSSRKNREFQYADGV